MAGANLVPSGGGFLPEIVDDKGKKVVGPELEAVTDLVTHMAQLAQLAKIRQAAEKQNFQGIEDPRNAIAATNSQQYIDLIHDHPNQPWISAFFENNGPFPVFIAVNNPTRPFRLIPNATRTVDHAYADKKVEIIYYWCNTGETAVFDIIGQY